MKKFMFSLARVRDWRRLQLETEEARLEPLLSERARIHREGDKLASSEREAAEKCGASIGERAALAAYAHYAAQERQRLAVRLAACETRIRAQQDAIQAARRRLRPLDNLQARRFAEWRVAADREQEELAQELYNARRIRARNGIS